jgi:hypothetical protein
MNLRISGQAGADTKAHIVIAVFTSKLTDEFRALRPRSDEAHFAAQNIPELRKFVQAKPPQVMANPCASRISGHGPNGAEVAFRVLVHRSEFDNHELPPVEPHSGLAVQHGPAACEAYGNRNQEEQRREQDQSGNGYGDVDAAFEKSA